MFDVFGLAWMINVKKGGFALHLVKARHVDEERLKSRRLQA